MPPLISFLILTYNEQENLLLSLNSLKELNASVYIVDSNSTDKTVDIAKKFGCYVYQNP
ncbi:MAG: glycosyltransferase, partial [Leptolyngbya sp. SIO3F4]|nr:glycosyltransferase [Leptolyngbya sp. SIO3F4]